MPVRDSFFTRYILPALVGLAASASVGAFTLVWNLSTKVALIESRQWVGREEFAVAKTELAQARADMERLREWMRNHVRTDGGRPEPAAYSYAARPVMPEADAAAAAAPAATPPPQR